jgi:ABC-type multidrug transport system fused ATPase/permease subunit
MQRERIFSHFLGFLRPHLVRFGLVFVASLGSALLSLAYPLLLKTVVDAWASSATLVRFAPAIALLAVATIAQAGISYASQFTFVRLTQRILGDVRIDLLRQLLDKPMAFFTREREGYVVSVFLNDINTINEMLTSGVLSLLLSMVTLIAVVGFMLFLEWRLTLVLIVFMAAFVAVYAALGPKVKLLSLQYHERLAGVSESLHEAYSGMRVLKSYNLEEMQRSRFASTVSAGISAFESLTRQGLLMTESSSLVTGLALIATLALAGLAVSSGAMTVGSAVAYLTLVSSCFGPLRGLVGANVRYRTALGAAERVVDLMDDPMLPALDVTAPGPAIRPGAPIVEFRDVHFSYDEAQILSGATFGIESGERILVRGPSGVGKSTVVDLMLRFYEPDSGTIAFMGHHLGDLDPKWVRDRIALVQQDPFLFNVTLRENLLLANPASTEIALRSAIEAVGLGELLATLPAGLDTPVGERGCMLSGGEKQRVAIARAILKRANLLVLDEATAWLDPKAEREMWDRIAGELSERTVVLITHDEQTSFRADRTLLFGAGRVASVAVGAPVG